MALDLFVNFERQSNSSIFYREVSAVPYAVSVKLSDLEFPDADLDSVSYFGGLSAIISFNNGSYFDFAPTNGAFVYNTTFNISTSCISSVDVRVGTFEPEEFLTSFSLSGIFLPSIPKANFILYPTYLFDLTTSQQLVLTATPTAYLSSLGAFFIGEGHTEVMNLSTNISNTTDTVQWFIGNSLSSLYETSFINAISEFVYQPTGQRTITAAISSQLNEVAIHPVHLRVSNTDILTSGPVLTYEDSDGRLSFYPFFVSTRNVDDTGSSENTTIFKQDIQVQPYPEPDPLLYNSPFPATSFNLPFDFSTRVFTAFVEPLRPLTGIFIETFDGSVWSIDAESAVGDWSVATEFLSSIYAYQFQLGYDNPDPEIEQIILPVFKAAPLTTTTINLGLTGYKSIKLDRFPFDWDVKRVPLAVEDKISISPLSFIKIYIQDYYNIKDTPVVLNLVSLLKDPYVFESLVVDFGEYASSVTLSGVGLSATAIFERVGTVDFKTVLRLKNKDTGAVEIINTTLPNMVEVVEQYDIIDEDHFRSNLTPFELTYNQPPKLSPNEWVTADNANSIIEKLYTISQELNNLTKIYERKQKFYGWTGPVLTIPPEINIEELTPTYVWQDLECPGNNDAKAAWSNFECQTNQTIFPRTWEYHECSTGIVDPSCLQKYCLEWKWKARRKGASDLDVTWRQTRCANEYAKKWRFEKCDLDSTPVNCVNTTWNIETIDSLSFPIPNCTPLTRCFVTDIEILNNLNKRIAAYATEIQMFDLDYNNTFVARRGIADELYSFQNIVGVAKDVDEKVYVLDNQLPRVSVFDAKDNDFKLFTTWGGFGLRANPQGFNRPSDIHIDQEGFVWIADTGNNCVKKLTNSGRGLLTIFDDRFTSSAPRSVCVDSVKRIHVLLRDRVVVFESSGSFAFEYFLSTKVINPAKINTSTTRDAVYVTYSTGVVKYFRNGAIADYVFDEYECASKQVLQNFGSLTQDNKRNLYITAGDKILKVQDLMNLVEIKGAIPENLYWSLEELLIHKEEYIQPWVYLKAFHRLWDNIELLRNSLFYQSAGCKSYTPAAYNKETLIIGQNEFVTNSAINRLSEQLWANMVSLIDYFDPSCLQKTVVDPVPLTIIEEIKTENTPFTLPQFL